MPLVASSDDGSGVSSVFWGWSYGNISGPKSQSGTGTCYVEANARHYIFWIGGDLLQRYHYVDCATGQYIGEWMDSLTGISTIQE